MQTCRRHYPGGTAEVFRSLRFLSAAAAFPVPLAGRLPRCTFRGLRGVHSYCGLPARGVAQGNPLHRRLRRLRYLHRRSDCYRLERNLAGRELHPLKTHAFSRRTKGKNCPGSRSCQGAAVIDPPGPGYPLLGCVPAMPNSVSPGRNESRSRLPAFQACRLHSALITSDGRCTPSRNPIELPGKTSKNPSGVSPIPPTVAPDVHERTLGARFSRMNRQNEA